MNRRRFLATATAASVLPLAGCSRVGLGTTELRPVGQETESGETHLLFGRDGRRLLTYTVRYHRGYVESAGQIPLEIYVWHAEDTHLDSFRVEVRAPAHSRDPHTRVLLSTPRARPWPEMTFERDDEDRTTIVAADGLGGVGDGTIGLEFLLEPASMPDVLPVAVSGAFDFSETKTLGRSYRAEGQMTVEIGREPEP